MTPQEKQWYATHGTPAEKQFVAQYGDRKVTTGLFSSVLFTALMFGTIFCVLAAYLYLSRSSYLRPVTGVWVGSMSSGEGAADSRVVYLSTAVDPLRWFRPSLKGMARMCNQQGESQFAVRQTRTVSADTLGVMLGTNDSEAVGELFGALRGELLSVQYDGATPGIAGKLHRGTLEQYEQACAALRK